MQNKTVNRFVAASGGIVHTEVDDEFVRVGIDGGHAGVGARLTRAQAAILIADLADALATLTKER